VYLAKVMHADGFSRIAAIKLVHQRWGENAEIAQRMRDEARLLGWLRHRNIVDVIDLTTIGGRVAVIMEYLEATSSARSRTSRRAAGCPARGARGHRVRRVRARRRYNRPPYEGEKPLHVHRDTGASNIMVDESGTASARLRRRPRGVRHPRARPPRCVRSADYAARRLFFEPDCDRSDSTRSAPRLQLLAGEAREGEEPRRSTRSSSRSASDARPWARSAAVTPCWS
jgi:serine/threonine protein kinase